MIRAIPQFVTQRYDRERVSAFLRFTLTRFLEDRCTQAAGALAYTSVFALVPLTAAILGILAAFPVFGEWRSQLTAFIFSNFVPAAGDTVQEYVTQFADNASKATAIGVLVLLFSAVALMMSIEDAFNRIWRVQAGRRPVSRFVIYWTALTLGPLLLVAALAISSYLFALPFIDAAEAQFSLRARVLGLLPFLIVWTALVAAFVVIPNREVRLRHAVVGALIAAVLFDLAKRGFAYYVTDLASYQKVYGALAMVPIFFFWIYLSWLIVLLGASITASLSAFDYRPPSQRLPEGHAFAGLLRVVGHLAQAQHAGHGLTTRALRDREPFLTDDLLQRYLKDMQRINMVRRTEIGEWVLTRSLDSLSVRDLYEAGDYRLPPVGLASGFAWPAQDLVQRSTRELDRELAVPLSHVFPFPAPAAAPAPEESR